jgi:hypothetical protein
MEFSLAELMQLQVQHALVNNLFQDQPSNFTLQQCIFN